MCWFFYTGLVDISITLQSFILASITTLGVFYILVLSLAVHTKESLDLLPWVVAPNWQVPIIATL